MEAVFFVEMAAINALGLPITVRAASILSSSREMSARPPAMMASQQLDQFARVAQLDASDALKISSATIAPMDSTHTRENATQSAQLEPLETKPPELGLVLPATLPVRLASITPHSVPAVSTEKDIFRPQL